MKLKKHPYTSTGVFNNGGYQFPILHDRLEHLRDSLLLEHAVLLSLNRQANIDSAALGGSDLGAKAVFRKIDLARIGRVDLDHGCRPCDLQLEGGRGGDGDG